MSVLDTEVDGSNPGSSMLFPWARHFIRIASVDSALKWVPGGDNLVKDVQCYVFFGGIAHKNQASSFSFKSMGLKFDHGKTKVIFNFGLTKDGMSKWRLKPCGFRQLEK